MVTPDTPPPAPGSVFGPYRLDSVIATGRTGVLYVATDQRLGRPVALKVVVGTLAASPGFVDRFQAEAATLARLESPHVVQVFDHGVQDGIAFIATQYAAGGDLGQLLARLGPMPLPLAAQAASQVAEALRDAHRAGVVHRNLKPSNVLLRDDRLDRVHVLVSDFGVGPVEGDAATEPASAAGAWNYLAPERLQGGPGSESADVYAVGCLLHEAVTGRPPFTGTDVEVAMAHLEAPVPQVPGTDDATQRLNRILARAMAKDPAERHESAGALRDELRAFAGILSSPPAGSPAESPSDDATRAPSTPPPPPPPPSFQSASIPHAAPYAGVPGPAPDGATDQGRKKRLAIVAGAVALLLVVGGGVAFALTSGGDDPEPGADPTSSPSTDGTDTGEPDPTGSPTETESTDGTDGTDGPVVPDTSGAITGDIDGDGLGDVPLSTFNGLQFLPSTGTAFNDIVVRKNLSGLSAVLGDVDNDGKVDVVRVSGEPPRMSVVASVAGSPVSALSTPKNPDSFSTLDYPVLLGDVSGDGNLDLVVYTALSVDKKAQIDVALGDGTGKFAAAETWFSGDLGETDGGRILVVDADEDGTGDVVRVTFGRATDGPQAILLTSDGAGTLTRTGEPTVVDTADFAAGPVVSGDFDGDGQDELVGMISGGRKASLWSWNGTTFDQTPWYDDSEAFDELRVIPSLYTASDVNGDGFDDIVSIGARNTQAGFVDYVDKAYVSDGTSFTPDLSWQRPLDLVTPDAYSSYTLMSTVTNTKP